MAGVAENTVRVEDQRFLTSKGRYSADVAAEGAAWAVLVRSPHAHADILATETGEAEKAPGVLGVFTGADLVADDLGHIPCMVTVDGKGGSETIVPPHPALAVERVYYVGEPVVLVVAETQDQARDASELVEVDYRDLPSVNETARALDPASPQIWPQAPSNVAVDWETGDAQEVARACALEAIAGSADGAARGLGRIRRGERAAYPDDAQPGRSRHACSAGRAYL